MYLIHPNHIQHKIQTPSKSYHTTRILFDMKLEKTPLPLRKRMTMGQMVTPLLSSMAEKFRKQSKPVWKIVSDWWYNTVCFRNNCRSTTKSNRRFLCKGSTNHVFHGDNDVFSGKSSVVGRNFRMKCVLPWFNIFYCFSIYYQINNI